MFDRIVAVSIICSVFLSVEAQGPRTQIIRRQIIDKVCSGKAIETQLDAVTKCAEDFQESFKNQVSLVNVGKTMDDCIKESGTDLGFAVSEANKRAVYMICSSKVLQCMHQKVPSSPLLPKSGNYEVTKSRDLLPEVKAKFEQMMECKKKALELK